MSLRRFLETLARSIAAQHALFDDGRDAMLRALDRKYRRVPHQILEDAAMQAFEQLWNDGVGEFRSPHPEDSDAFRQDLVRYLALVIAPRRLVDMLRRSGLETLVGDLKKPNQQDVSDDDLFDRLLPPPEDDTVGGLERKRLLQRLGRCVEHLSPKLRDVVQGLLGDVRQADTAEALGIPEGTVKSRMNEATKRLKRCMGIGTEHT